MSKEIVKVKIYNGRNLIKCQDFTSYDNACSYARKQVEYHGYAAKIQRIVDGKPWVVTNIYPKETF